MRGKSWSVVWWGCGRYVHPGWLWLGYLLRLKALLLFLFATPDTWAALLMIMARPERVGLKKNVTVWEETGAESGSTTWSRIQNVAVLSCLKKHTWQQTRDSRQILKEAARRQRVSAYCNITQNKTKAAFSPSSQLKIHPLEDPEETVMLKITSAPLSHCLSLSSLHLPINISACCL